MQPKTGDRFIHARYLADDASPPYDSEASYAVHVVTRVSLCAAGSESDSNGMAGGV